MSVKEQEHSEEAKVEEKKGESAYFEELKSSLEGTQDVQEKLKLILTFMEESLGRPEGPRFGDFWEARKLCLPLFREGVDGDARGELWTSYTYLTGEAKSLRDKVDQEGQFAVEQIELALEAIELDSAQRHGANAQVQDVELPHFMKGKGEEVQARLKELVILDALASRVTALRQGLIETQIRMRQKNALFQRLSAVGDLIFPPRKELLREVTDFFLNETETFSKVKFPNGEPRGPLHALRDEIKAFQSLAKVLRLTPKGFHKSRQILSKCWDAVREQSEERRKVWAEKSKVFKANQAVVSEKIQAFAAAYAENEPSIEEAQAQVAGLMKAMHETELGNDEVKALRKELDEAQAPLTAKLDEQRAAAKAEEDARRQEREARVLALKESIETLLADDDADADSLAEKRDALLTEIKEAALPKFEKAGLEKSIRPLRETIRRRKEDALLQLSDDDKQALSNLQEVLRQRQERRNEFKARVEELRKEQGASGLDFVKAMELNEQVAERKEQLDQAEAEVREIEERIQQLV